MNINISLDQVLSALRANNIFLLANLISHSLKASKQCLTVCQASGHCILTKAQERVLRHECGCGNLVLTPELALLKFKPQAIAELVFGKDNLRKAIRMPKYKTKAANPAAASA